MDILLQSFNMWKEILRKMERDQGLYWQDNGQHIKTEK